MIQIKLGSWEKIDFLKAFFFEMSLVKQDTINGLTWIAIKDTFAYLYIFLFSVRHVTSGKRSDVCTMLVFCATHSNLMILQVSLAVLLVYSIASLAVNAFLFLYKTRMSVFPVYGAASKHHRDLPIVHGGLGYKAILVVRKIAFFHPFLLSSWHCQSANFIHFLQYLLFKSKIKN